MNRPTSTRSRVPGFSQASSLFSLLLFLVFVRCGRFTIMMPHPERTHRTVQKSWAPDTLGEFSPWMRMFRNARKFVG